MSMPKQVIFGADARDKLKRGVDTLANAVKTTLGPRGRNVLLGKKFGSPVVTKDGVTVAREISLKDSLEDAGAQLVREVASKTNDVAGDGTTTATVLAQAIFAAGLRNVAVGASATDIKRGIEKAAEIVADKLVNDISCPLDDKEDVEKVAAISANDPEIGKTIAELMNSLGESAVVTVEDSSTFGVSKEVVDGMRLDRGFVSPYMMTDRDRLEAVYADVPVLVTTKKLQAGEDIAPLLDKLLKIGKKDVVIVADDIEGNALAMLVVNRLQGVLNPLAIKAPGYGENKIEVLKDLAALTGATLVSDELGMKMSELDVGVLGSCRKVVSNKDNTTFVDGGGDKTAIQARVAEIKTAIEKTDSDFDKTKLKERLAKLSGGVGVIKVGAATESEQKEVKQRIEDAVSATKAAIEEGIVPGGGVALLRAAEGLNEGLNLDEKSDENVGTVILLQALEAPLAQIARNAGEDGSVVVSKVKELEGSNGFNALTGEYEDLTKSGVIDPTKVTRAALQNAVSIASLLLMTEVVVVEEPEDKKEEQPRLDI